MRRKSVPSGSSFSPISRGLSLACYIYMFIYLYFWESRTGARRQAGWRARGDEVRVALRVRLAAAAAARPGPTTATHPRSIKRGQGPAHLDGVQENNRHQRNQDPRTRHGSCLKSEGIDQQVGGRGRDRECHVSARTVSACYIEECKCGGVVRRCCRAILCSSLGTSENNSRGMCDAGRSCRHLPVLKFCCVSRTNMLEKVIVVRL